MPTATSASSSASSAGYLSQPVYVMQPGGGQAILLGTDSTVRAAYTAMPVAAQIPHQPTFVGAPPLQQPIQVLQAVPAPQLMTQPVYPQVCVQRPMYLNASNLLRWAT